jgi:hypothetical protein
MSFRLSKFRHSAGYSKQLNWANTGLKIDEAKNQNNFDDGNTPFAVPIL